MHPVPHIVDRAAVDGRRLSLGSRPCDLTGGQTTSVNLEILRNVDPRKGDGDKFAMSGGTSICFVRRNLCEIFGDREYRYHLRVPCRSWKTGIGAENRSTCAREPRAYVTKVQPGTRMSE